MRRLHQYFLCLLFAFSMLPAKAQRLDSLLKVLHNYNKDDSKKLSLLNLASIEYKIKDLGAASKLADAAIELGKRIKDENGLADAYRIKGEILNTDGNCTGALELLQLSLNQFEALGDRKSVV